MKLIKYDEACAALEAASTIDEAREIQSQAEALEVYYRQTKNLDLERQIAQIKLRAKRRIGEISRDLEKMKPEESGGLHTAGAPTSGNTSKKETLKQAGLTTSVANRYEKIAAIPESEFEAVLAESMEQEKPITFSQVEKKVFGDRKKEERKANIEKQAKQVVTEPSLHKKYHVICIDPPWKYDTDYDSDGRRAASPYPEMPIIDIAKIEIPAQDDCVLWLWTTHKFLKHSFELLDGWGFRDVSVLTWVKNRIGLGSWLRSQTEFCIMAVKGSPVVNLTNQSTVLHGSTREHSRKPDEFYDMVDSLCSGAKLDYFSREHRDGWDQYGNDTEKF